MRRSPPRSRSRSLPTKSVRAVHDDLRRVDAAAAAHLRIVPLPLGVSRIAKRVLPAEIVPVVDMERRATTSSRLASSAKKASAATQDEQPWLVKSSTTPSARRAHALRRSQSTRSCTQKDQQLSRPSASYHSATTASPSLTSHNGLTHGHVKPRARKAARDVRACDCPPSCGQAACFTRFLST